MGKRLIGCHRSILENMELGLMEVDTNNVITKVYDRFCDMTGYTAIELIGQNAVEIFRCEDYENLVSVDGSNRSNGASAVFETTLRRKDGESIWVLISGAPFYDAQKQRIDQPVGAARPLPQIVGGGAGGRAAQDGEEAAHVRLGAHPFGAAAGDCPPLARGHADRLKEGVPQIGYAEDVGAALRQRQVGE